MGDLLSLKQLQLPVKIVVFNNSSLGFIELEQKSSGFVDFGTGFDNPDFAALAEAVGIKGIRIEDPADLESGIAEALAHDGPVLIDAVVAEVNMKQLLFDFLVRDNRESLGVWQRPRPPPGVCDLVRDQRVSSDEEAVLSACTEKGFILNKFLLIFCRLLVRHRIELSIQDHDLVIDENFDLFERGAAGSEKGEMIQAKAKAPSGSSYRLSISRRLRGETACSRRGYAESAWRARGVNCELV